MQLDNSSNVISFRPATVQSSQSQAEAQQITRLLDEDEAAAFLNCSAAFLRRCRLRRVGPDYVKVGRLVRYSAESLERYIEVSTRQMAA